MPRRFEGIAVLIMRHVLYTAVYSNGVEPFLSVLGWREAIGPRMNRDHVRCRRSPRHQADAGRPKAPHATTSRAPASPGPETPASTSPPTREMRRERVDRSSSAWNPCPRRRPARRQPGVRSNTDSCCRPRATSCDNSCRARAQRPKWTPSGLWLQVRPPCRVPLQPLRCNTAEP